MIQLVEKEFASFFDVPFKVYGDKYPFVSQLKPDFEAMLTAKNPYLKTADLTYFTAKKDGAPFGRIVAHVHKAANERFKEKTASFGFLDCADDVEVARTLLDAAEKFGRDRGCDRIRGNMNLTANQEIGVLVEGDQKRPYLAQIYNPAYVSKLLEQCGYAKTKPMTSFVKDDVQTFDTRPMLTDKHRLLLVDGSWNFRAFDTRRFAQEVEAVRRVLNDAMADNYLFVPMTEEEAQFQLGPLERVLDPELTRMAEHNGEVVGVALGVPDVVPLLQRMKGRLFPFGWWHFLTMKSKLDTFTVIIILTKKAYHSAGVMRVLTAQLFDAAKARGYKSAAGTWIGDDNAPSLKSAAAVGMKPYHRLYMYEKAL